jgi:hypothetical protein
VKFLSHNVAIPSKIFFSSFHRAAIYLEKRGTESVLSAQTAERLVAGSTTSKLMPALEADTAAVSAALVVVLVTTDRAPVAERMRMSLSSHSCYFAAATCCSRSASSSNARKFKI